jgi:ankyrin repeat protein
MDGLVRVGFDINARDRGNFTALCIACYWGKLDAVTELVHLGADLEVACGEGGITAVGKQPEVIKLLLQAGARVNFQSSNGGTALYEAASRNYAKVIEVLVEGGADPNLSGETLGTPLYAAVFNGAIDAAKVLVWNGANLEARWLGSTALHLAALRNDTKMVRLLVEAGAEVDAIDDQGLNALHIAALVANVGMLRFLRAAGSWPDTPDKLGQTALHFAVMTGMVPVVKEVLSWRGIDVSARSNELMTPLHIAAARGFLKIAELLIEAGADVNAVMVDQYGASTTVLRAAVTNNRPEVVGLLLRVGAEVDPSGALLKEAAGYNCRGAIKVLLGARDWPDEVKAAAEELVRARADLCVVTAADL